MMRSECYIDTMDLTEQLIGVLVLPPTTIEQAGEQLTQVSFQPLNTETKKQSLK